MSIEELLTPRYEFLNDYPIYSVKRNYFANLKMLIEDVKDLPKHVKFNGLVKMVIKWSIANSKTVDLLCCCDVDFFTPATEEEYLEFKKGKAANA